jgi:arylsulfatase/uncharacterized sulfatase
MRFLIPLILLVFGVGFINAQVERVSALPNIVMILIDDAGLMDLGVYGGEASTPNIDALAQQVRTYQSWVVRLYAIRSGHRR